MEVLLFGPLEIWERGRSLMIPTGRRRALLCLLALNAGRIMRAERLMELLWVGEPPRTAANALQVHISALRKILEPEGPPFRLLVSVAGGYQLRLTAEQIDLTRFERLVQQGRQALGRGDVQLSRRLLDDAFELWRGSPLAEFADEPWAVGEVGRLDDLRLAAEEDRIESELALGQHAAVVPQLEALIEQHPLRERFRGQLMVALYRSGRQAEATELYRRTRALLVEELAMEPGYELQRINRAILNQDPALASSPSERPPGRQDNLPSPTTSFVGRQREMGELAAMLQRSRLVTLIGIGGIGKTRLAIETARGLLGSYDRGIWMVGMASIAEPELVTEAVASALELRPRAGQTLVDACCRHFATGRRLLILDNCEHVIEACAHLVDSLLSACPGLTVLATSREALGVGGEHVWQVAPLGVEAPAADGGQPRVANAAVRLFEDRALASAPALRFDTATRNRAQDVCQRLDGIPLAIEIAASRLDSLSVDELAALLEDRFAALISSRRTTLPRHQTLRAALNWSYDLLDGPERALLSMISVFPGGFTLAAAAFVADSRQPRDVLSVLSRLVRKSLVLLDRTGLETRYVLLDTIRDYAHAKLTEVGDVDAIRRRHAGYYCDLAERGAPQLRGPNAANWMSRFAAEHDNLRAALQWTCDAADTATFTRLLAALWWFWYVRGFLREGRMWFERGLQQAEPPALATRAQLLLGAGQLAWAQGDGPADRDFFDEALAHAKRAGDDVLIGEAFLRLSLSDCGSGRMHDAAEHLEQAIALLRRRGPPSILAEALNNLGWIRAIAMGQVEPAVPMLQKSLALARECGDQWVLALVLDSLAEVMLAEGRVDDAEAFQKESLSICGTLGDVWFTPRALLTMMAIALERGAPGRAVRLAAASTNLLADVGAALMPTEQTQYDRLLTLARGSLTPEAANSAWREGSRMSLTEAIDCAVSLWTA